MTQGEDLPRTGSHLPKSRATDAQAPGMTVFGFGEASDAIIRASRVAAHTIGEWRQNSAGPNGEAVDFDEFEPVLSADELKPVAQLQPVAMTQSHSLAEGTNRTATPSISGMSPITSIWLDATGIKLAYQVAHSRIEASRERFIRQVYGDRGRLDAEASWRSMLEEKRFWAENRQGWNVSKKLIKERPLSAQEQEWYGKNRGYVDDFTRRIKKYFEAVLETAIPKAELQAYYTVALGWGFDDWAAVDPNAPDATLENLERKALRPGTVRLRQELQQMWRTRPPPIGALHMSQMTLLDPMADPSKVMEQYASSVGRRQIMRPLLHDLLDLRNKYQEANLLMERDTLDGIIDKTVLGTPSHLEEALSTVAKSVLMSTNWKPGQAFRIDGSYGYEGTICISQSVNSSRGPAWEVELNGQRLGQPFTAPELSMLASRDSVIGRWLMSQKPARDVVAFGSHAAAAAVVAGNTRSLIHHLLSDMSGYLGAYDARDSTIGQAMGARALAYQLGAPVKIAPEKLAQWRRVGLLNWDVDQSPADAQEEAVAAEMSPYSRRAARALDFLGRIAFANVSVPDTYAAFGSFEAALSRMGRTSPEMPAAQMEALAAIEANQVSRYTAATTRAPLMSHPLSQAVVLFQRLAVRDAAHNVALVKEGPYGWIKLFAENGIKLGAEAPSVAPAAGLMRKEREYELLAHALPFATAFLEAAATADTSHAVWRWAGWRWAPG